MNPTLSPGNTVIADALMTAVCAIHRLDALGRTVLDVEIIAGGRPKLRVDRAPASVRDVCVVTRTATYVDRVNVVSVAGSAAFHGCRLEWENRG